MPLLKKVLAMPKMNHNLNIDNSFILQLHIFMHLVNEFAQKSGKRCYFW